MAYPYRIIPADTVRTRAGKPTPAQERAALKRPDSDPPTRADGACIICERERPPAAITHDDPFCSATCAREHHGAQLPNS